MMEQVVKNSARDKVIADVKCWVLHALTSAAGLPLLVRQTKEFGNVPMFMGELKLVRRELENQVNAMDLPALQKLFTSGKPDLTVLTPITLFCEEEWKMFVHKATLDLKVLAMTAEEIAKHKYQLLSGVFNA